MGSGRSQTAVDSIRIHYRLGHREVDTLYRDNGAQLSRFLKLVRDARESDSIEQLVIRSYASPDGSNTANERLSVRRAEGMRSYLAAHTEVPDSLIKEEAMGIAWDDLCRMVQELDVPWRDEVVDIIVHTPLWIFDRNNRIVDGRKKRLMDLRRGVPYRYMYEHLFPQLRSSLAVQVYLKTTDGQEHILEHADVPSSEPEEVVSVEQPAETTAEPEVSRQPERGEKVQRLALKTNLIYDALLMPSLEVEYRINRRWSVNLEGDMAWWKNDGRHKYYQLATISPEGRYWFRTRKPWHGHYVGLFGGFTWYDLENGKRGYKGEAEMAGLSYGFMWPIARRLSLETGVGVGFLHTRYEEYLPIDGCYVYQQTKKMNYFGPLKLKLTLVWRLWNEKQRKGGGA